MKKIFSIVICLIFLSSFCKLKAQDYYYWYHEVKQPLRIVEKQQYILVKSESAANNLSNKMASFHIKLNFQKLVLSSSLKLHESDQYWSIITLPDQIKKIEDTAIIYSSPFFFTENGVLIGISHLFYVKLKTADDFAQLEKIAKENNVKILGKNNFMPLWYTLSCSNEPTIHALEMANIFYETGLFLEAIPDIMTDDYLNCVNDIFFSDQWGLKNTGQNGGVIGIDINYCNAKQITSGNANIVIALLDQGIELNHPDLTNIYSLSFDTENGYGPSIVRGPHGTACAGIIGANTNNNIGIAGIASNCPIMSISNSLTPSPDSRMKRADGINYAWINGASVISNSWRSPIQYPVIDDAISNAVTYGRNGNGCVVVFSSGNDYDSAVSYPAKLDNVIAVGSINPSGFRVNYSNYGSALDLVAPGVNISTTDLQGNDGYNSIYSILDDYTNTAFTKFFDGTSAAAPHVSGVAALMLSVNPDLTGQQVQDILESTAQKLNGYSFHPASSEHPNGTWNNHVGYGLVDAYAAVVEACLYGHQISGDTNVNTCQISPFYYEGNLLDNFKIYWKVSPNCIIYSGQLSTHVEVVPLYGDTATLYAYIILNNDTLKVFSKKLSITDYNTNIVTPNLSNGIPLDSVWNTDYTLITSVTIPKGRKLTINADVSCMPHVKIIVENGGRLVINNAEISSHCENILWRGIEVWGSPDTSQYYVSRNVTSPLQGEVVLNNAVIKDAICGVRVGNTRLRNYGKGGGVIKATNTQFVNNKEAVHFNAYIRVSNAHKVVDNISYFNECIFKVDNNAYFVVDTSNVQVALYNVRGVQFNGCQFEDMQSKSDWQNFGTAIYASQSGFRINEQTDMFQYPATYYNTPCTFNNYKNAIAIVGSAEKPVKIYNTLFSDNSTGVNAKNADALSIKSCSFSSGNESFSSYVHGLILDSCNFYRIENNQFTGIGNGIKIIGKTADNNTIRLNTFNSLCKAIEVYGKNGNENEYNDKIELTGLQFECNDFVTDSTDIYLHGQATIKCTQGSTSHACGNYFGDQSIMHFNNLNEQLLLIYFYNYTVNAQKPIRYSHLDTIGVTHDICGNRHGYIGDSYYNMPKILTDYENLYDANFQLYVSALDNYNSTYEGISIDWDNITAIDVTSNPQLFDLIQLSELKNILDETCIEAIHLLGNSTEVEITEITTWLQRLSSLDADLLGIHYLAQGNDVSQLQLAWDQITQHYSIVNPEDTSYYQYCINQINTWARDTATDVNISQGAIDTLTAIANSNNTASPYAVSVLECINEHYPWWRLRIHTSCNWVFLVESMSPKKETEQGQTDAIQLHPNPTNGMIEIQSNNLNIKQIELYDIFGKLLMEKKANESTVTLDVSPYAKGMYLLRYTLSDDTQQTKKIIKE
ncbi:MAG: S8 family serine peptidase [Bacteroidales bacterium]|nr:S8 family serine peptidase [Bacteroidales bacterium]